MGNKVDTSKMDEKEVVARTLYGEARGESDAGLYAVACVIMNRVIVAEKNGGKYWWGATPREVCLKKFQFSCWGVDDANRRSMLEVKDTDEKYRECLKLSEKVIAKDLIDVSEGADHYHTKNVYPGWSRNQEPTAVIGNHYFYRLVD